MLFHNSFRTASEGTRQHFKAFFQVNYKVFKRKHWNSFRVNNEKTKTAWLTIAPGRKSRVFTVFVSGQALGKTRSLKGKEIHESYKSTSWNVANNIRVLTLWNPGEENCENWIVKRAYVPGPTWCHFYHTPQFHTVSKLAENCQSPIIFFVVWRARRQYNTIDVIEEINTKCW